MRARRDVDREEDDGDDHHGQRLDGQLGQAVLEELLEVLDVAGHPGHDHAGLLLGEEAEGEPLEVGEDLDPQVVHHPGGDPAGDLDLGALGQRGDADEHQVEPGHGHHHGEVLVSGAHAVVDGVLGQLGADLADHGDHHDQEAGQDQHARVLGQQAPQGQAPQLLLGGVLVEGDVGFGVRRARSEQAVHAGLELRGDAGEGEAGGRRPPDRARPPPQPHRRSHAAAPGHRAPRRGGARARSGRRPPSSPAASRSVLRLELGRLGQDLGVEGGGGQQLGVGAVGHDLLLVEEHHPVGQRDGGQAVGDDEGGPALHEDAQAGVDLLLDLDVDGAGGVVEDQDRRVDQQGAGDGDALALAARERVAALADHGVVAVVEGGDEPVGAGGPGGGLDLVDGGVGLGRRRCCRGRRPRRGRARRGRCRRWPAGCQGEVAHVVTVDPDRPAVTS